MNSSILIYLSIAIMLNAIDNIVSQFLWWIFPKAVDKFFDHDIRRKEGLLSFSLTLTLAMQTLVALSFLILLSSINARTADRSGRIVGGEEAPDGFAPWAVILRFDGEFFGMAVVISERFVSWFWSNSKQQSAWT